MGPTEAEFATVSPILAGFVGSLVAGLATGVGAIPVFFRREWPEQSQVIMLAVAGGIMLAATVFSLIIPAMEVVVDQQGSEMRAAATVSAGVVLGALGIWLIHATVPHEHFVKGPDGRSAAGLGRHWLFILAITLHNFPEGMSVGVAFGPGDLRAGLAITTGIGLQNMPEGLAVAAALITRCADNGWDWRLRLKGCLLVHDRSGGETRLADCFACGEWLLSEVTLTEKRASTLVAMIHEPEHPEPWMIAMSQPPTLYRALDYALRWGVEALFSDAKTLGFNLESSQLRRADRIERLILVIALALYWTVSTGMWDAVNNPSAAEKKTPNTARADMLAPCSPSSSEASAESCSVSSKASPYRHSESLGKLNHGEQASATAVDFKSGVG